MNKDNLPQFSKDIFKIWEVALLKGRPLYGTDMKKKPQFSENEIRIDELNRLEVHADLPHLLDYVLRRYEELEMEKSKKFLKKI